MPDPLRSNAVLPPFRSDQAESLRERCDSAQDFIALADRATGSDDWLHWSLRIGLTRFPHSAGLISRNLRQAALQGATERVSLMRIIALSLPAPDRVDPVMIEALACSDFLSRDIETGSAKLAALAQQFPDHVPTVAQSLDLRLAQKLGDVARAADLARRIVSTDPAVQQMQIAALSATQAFADIIVVIDRSGGMDQVTDPQIALAYLTAQEALGHLDMAMTAAIEFLARRPDSLNVAHFLRHLAIRLDRLPESLPSLNQAAIAGIETDEGIAFLALLALDSDKYERARRVLQLTKGAANLALKLSLAVTDPNVTRRQARRAYRAYRRSGVTHAGPEMQYASHMFNEARKPRDLRAALRVVRTGLPYAQDNPYFHRLYLSLLIANGHADTARAHFQSLPEGLRQTQRLAAVGIYFDQIDGAHARAKARWKTHAPLAGFRVFDAQTTPARLAKDSQGQISGPVIAFSLVYNGMDYLQAYFAHYRALGIRGFVIVDNGSTDGTREYLARQPDVVLYQHPGSFRAAAHGVAWINPLIQKHALGRWALFVDIDEHLVFPHAGQGRSIANLVAYADDQGAGCFPSFMLDLFATPRSFDLGFAGHCFFDREYLRYPSISLPFTAVQGGVRGRLTGRHFLITKSPLVKVDRDLQFLENNHIHSYAPCADVTTALLHYKFVGDTRHKFTEAVTRGEHFLGGRFYRDMLARLRGNGIARGLWSRRYRGDGQLVKMGLIQTSQAWDDWTATDD